MFVPLIYYVTDHNLLQATRQTQHALLQFISVMNFRLVVAAAFIPPPKKNCSQPDSDPDCWQPQVW